MTHTGQILGTPSYRPPEQAAGVIDAVTPAADIYALGSILYCLLTGRPPFQAANPLDTLLQVLHNEAPSPREINPNIPRDLETICLKCLQKEVSRRYASAQELADDLGRYQRDEPIQARPVGRIERAMKWVKRRPAVAALLGVVALSLVAGTVVPSMFAVRASLNAQAEYNARKAAEASEHKAKDLADDKTRLAAEKSQLAESERVAREQQERLKSVAIDERNTAMRNLYVAHAYQFQHAWSENRYGRLNEMLKRWERDSNVAEVAKLQTEPVQGPNSGESGYQDVPDPRGFEWHYLRFQCDKTITVLPEKSVDTSVAWRHDGEQIAASSYSKEVTIWDVERRKLLKVLRGHPESVLHTAWSHDGFSGRLL